MPNVRPGRNIIKLCLTGHASSTEVRLQVHYLLDDLLVVTPVNFDGSSKRLNALP